MLDLPHTPTGPGGLEARALKGGWREARGADCYVLTRHWPPRFDVSASASFPLVRRGRLARQIRQDLWRELKGLRGFSPVVKVDVAEGGLRVTAGGQFMAGTRVAPGLAARILALLDCPARRSRWLSWAVETAA